MADKKLIYYDIRPYLNFLRYIGIWLTELIMCWPSIDPVRASPKKATGYIREVPPEWRGSGEIWVIRCAVRNPRSFCFVYGENSIPFVFLVDSGW